MPLNLNEPQTCFAEPFTAIQLESHTVRSDSIIATYSYGNMVNGEFVSIPKEPDTSIIEIGTIADILTANKTGSLYGLTKHGIYEALQRRLGIIGVVS